MDPKDLRTYPIKGLMIFLSVVLVVCPGFSVLAYLLFDDLAMKVVFWVICTVFFAIAAVLFCNQLFFYVQINGDTIIVHKMFRKTVIPFDRITNVKIEDGFYVGYHSDARLFQFGTEQKNAGNMVSYMERRGVHINWYAGH